MYKCYLYVFVKNYSSYTLTGKVPIIIFLKKYFNIVYRQRLWDTLKKLGSHTSLNFSNA